MDHVDDVLGRTPLFGALDADGASALRAEMRNVEIERGERLFSEGDGGDKLYVVLDGKIKLTRTSAGRPGEPAERARARRDVR